MRQPSVVLALAVLVGGSLVAARLDGQEPVASPAAAAPAASESEPGPDLHGFPLGSSRKTVVGLLDDAGISYKETAVGRLRFSGSLDPAFQPAPEVSHVVFDLHDRLAVVDFRWPIGGQSRDPFREFLEDLRTRFGTPERTGGRDYSWEPENIQGLIVRLYENRRRNRDGGVVRETVLRYVQKGARFAQGAERLD